MVFVSYYPSDSVAVEQGDALWLGMLALAISTIAWTFTLPAAPSRHSADPAARWRFSAPRADLLLDATPWMLAAWMMIAAVASSPPGNLRMATNEVWLWVTAAAIFTAARRLLVDLRTRQALLVLAVVCASGLSVHGWHQQWISFPANRAEYRQDPDRVLRLAGVDAPEGSAERMVFENRLFDGGPSATFALANSLAAVLLIGAVAGVGVLRFQWRILSRWQRIAWTAAALTCASGLIAARSRSATLAMLLGVSMIFVVAAWRQERNSRRHSRRMLIAGLAAVTTTAVIGTGMLAKFGNREWFEQAPASLAFRLQYWQATLRMMADRPWFGAGPGNFQSLYERYRAANTTEQIAEPHNLFFETLASGGWVALGLLAFGIVAGLHWGASQNPEDSVPRAANTESCTTGPTRCEGGRWLWLGSAIGLGLIWLIGWASRQPPDFEANLFAVPVAIGSAVVLWPSVRTLTSGHLDQILRVVLVSIVIHLMVAGGWTVPGIASWVWVTAAILTRKSSAGGADASPPDWRQAVVFGVGLVLLTSLYFLSLRPVEQCRRMMATAALAQSNGQVGKARVSLESAVQSDPWSFEATLWLADFYRWQIVLQGDSVATRKRWEGWLAQAKRRAGENPGVYRQIGTQQLHVYQKFGLRADLDAAADTFRQALRWSPSNQWMTSQMAVIERAVGEDQTAHQLAERARTLSELGGNLERTLSMQQIFVARRIGTAADHGPIREPADQLFEPWAGR